MSFNPKIIAEPKIEFWEELLQSICRLKWFDYEGVQSMPQMLIDPRFRLLEEWLRLLEVVCWLTWMPWIPLFWVLAMLGVQSSCFAICCPPRIFHSNYLPMSPRLCSIRGTCQIRLLGVYCFFVGSIFRWWCTRYIVHGWIISWLAHRWPFRWTDWCGTMMALVGPILQVLKTCQVMALHRSRLSDIVNSELRVGSHQMMFFCRVCS